MDGERPEAFHGFNTPAAEITVRDDRRLLFSELSNKLLPVAIVAAIISVGCGGRRTQEAHAADTLGTVVGNMFSPFMHESPFYGTVVYLIPNTQASRDWWDRLTRKPNYWMRTPKDLELPYLDRTTCEDGGHFAFLKVRPGDYYLHANVFWVTFGGESTEVGGRAWIGSTTAAAGETALVTLRPPEFVFR